MSQEPDVISSSIQSLKKNPADLLFYYAFANMVVVEQ